MEKIKLLIGKLKENWKKYKIFIVIILFLIIANIFAITFLVFGNSFGMRFKNPYPFIDPARSLVNQEHFITNLQPLRDSIKELVAQEESNGFKISVYIEYLNTGANISINHETGIWPASLAKVPLSMAVIKKIESGDWKLFNELVLMSGDADEKSGDGENPLSEYPVGTRFSIENLLKSLLIDSDNTAYNILKRNLHQDERNRVIEDLGLQELFSKEGRMSAKEYSRIFRVLYTSSFLTREHSQKILQWLDESPYDVYLSYGINKKVHFPHKYGENIDLNVYSDSGIVYIPNRPYLITVMIEGSEKSDWKEIQKQSQDFMRSVSEKTYEYFSVQNK